MNFNLKIHCGNAAFLNEDGSVNGEEIARLLEKAAGDVREGVAKGNSGALIDINGNKVGSWSTTKR